MLNEIYQYLPDDHPWAGTIHYYDTITSTNDVLKQMALDGAPHGTVLIADRQTGGRGRLGRSFLSPPNVGIYMSVLIRPGCESEKLMHLTCAAAVAMCNAIESSAGFRPSVKWTNDIVYRSKKLAGILAELGFHSGNTVDYAVIGIGVNCCQRVEDFSPEIRGFAGSLDMVGPRKVDRAAVAAAMITELSGMSGSLISDKEQIMKQYRSDCITVGQMVSVIRADHVRHGKALDVDGDGALVVAFDDGTVEAVGSGEVSVRGMYGYV